MLTIPTLTLVFMVIVFGLATTFVWALWELEPKIAKLQHRSNRFPADRIG